MINEELLIAAIENLVGKDNLYVFRSLDVQGQFDLFQNAKIILGPHGSGFTNMLWAEDGATVIEFPLIPHENRNMGMLAMMCNHDFWLIPSISASYYDKYTINDENLASLLRLLTQAINKMGLQRLLSNSRTDL